MWLKLLQTTQSLPHPPIRPLSPFSSLCFSYFPVSHSTTLCVPLFTFSLSLLLLSFWLNYHKCRSWPKYASLFWLKLSLLYQRLSKCLWAVSVCVGVFGGWVQRGSKSGLGGGRGVGCSSICSMSRKEKMQPDNTAWWKIKKSKNKMGTEWKEMERPCWKVGTEREWDGNGSWQSWVHNRFMMTSWLNFRGTFI